MFSSRIFPLATLWVEDLQETDTIRNAIRLQSPSETIVVFAPTADEKAGWLNAFRVSIAGFVRSYDERAEMMVMTDAAQGLALPQFASLSLGQLDRRHAAHDYKLHPFYGFVRVRVLCRRILYRSSSTRASQSENRSQKHRMRGVFAVSIWRF